MATTCTYKSYGNPTNGNTVSEVSGTVSQADESFLNISNPLAPTAGTVTADKIRTRLITPSVAATAGIEPGQYERVSGSGATVVYRKTT